LVDCPCYYFEPAMDRLFWTKN